MKSDSVGPTPVITGSIEPLHIMFFTLYLFISILAFHHLIVLKKSCFFNIPKNTDHNDYSVISVIGSSGLNCNEIIVNHRAQNN